MNWNALEGKLSTYATIARSRRFLVAGLGCIMAGAATLVGALLILLWGSSVGSADIITIPAAAVELQFGSSDGVLMVGVFDTSGPRWGWRRNTLSLYTVHPDSDNNVFGFGFAGNLYGWAVAVPHLLVVAFVMIVPAWWVLVVRSRHEINHRRQHGLCARCGYDLRESPETCPECGAAGAGAIRTRRGDTTRMKRSKRIKVAWVVTLTALTLVTAAWARSYWRVDVFSHVDSEGATRAIVSRAGALHVVDSQTHAALGGFDFGSYDMPDGQRLPVLHNAQHLRWHRLGFALVRADAPPRMWVQGPPVVVPSTQPIGQTIRQRRPLMANPGMMIVANPQPRLATDVVPWLSGLPYFELVVPYWSLAALAMLYPLVRATIALRKSRRRRRGLCGDCGYDLRATRERCPEGGAAVPAPQRARTGEAVVA